MSTPKRRKTEWDCLKIVDRILAWLDSPAGKEMLAKNVPTSGEKI